MLLVHVPYPVFISIQCIFELFLLRIKLKQASHMVTTYQQSFTFFIHHFYRTMLCIRGTSHGPVSVRLSVCPFVGYKSVFY